MLRVCLALALLGLLVFAAPRTTSVVTAASGSSKAITSGPAVQVTLKEQLEKGLKARRPEEFEFVALVVKEVEEGRLPIKSVNSAYDWALRQPRYPFQYFEFAISKIGKKYNVVLKPVP